LIAYPPQGSQQVLGASPFGLREKVRYADSLGLIPSYFEKEEKCRARYDPLTFVRPTRVGLKMRSREPFRPSKIALFVFISSKLRVGIAAAASLTDMGNI
jgi:hypothetical protein